MPTMWLSDNQSKKRLVCTLRTKAYPGHWLTQVLATTEIGVIFCSAGGLFLFGGVLMFFDRSLLAMGNILFLIGLTLIIGLEKTFAFFSRRQKLKGTAAFAAGILLILLRWPLTGFIIELYGLFILFGDFLITIGQFAGNIPVVGPFIQKVLETLAGGRRNAELPV
ncbi:Golgi Transport [Aspergillus niger]|nr:Golgi Transport [Aspergillus niger]